MSRLGARSNWYRCLFKKYQIAKVHAKQNKLNIVYLNKSPEQLKSKEKFDIILNLEVVEHVENLNLYLKSCFNILKNNGIMFTATINRTLFHIKSNNWCRIYIKMASYWNT